MEDSSKRRFLRGAAVAALMGGLAAGVGAQAWAHGGPGSGPHGRGSLSGPIDPARMEARLERMVKHLAVEVDATSEQTAKLAEIAKSAARELAPMRQKARDARRQAMDLLAAPTVDRAAIERLRGEQIQAADAASRRLSQALADAAEVLTPDQRRKAAEHLRAWRGPRRESPRQRG